MAEICARHRGRVVFDFVGVIGHTGTRRALATAGVPVRYSAPRPQEREYPLFMPWYAHRTQWDIAIAPLADTPFRRCKSDIKFLDYAAIGAAAVLSDVGPYPATVRHGETGWLVENTSAAWVDALERLIADAELRRHLAEGARRYLFDERVLARRAGDWPAAVGRAIGGGV